MKDQQQAESHGHWNPGKPVPAGRPLRDFCMERVGDDVVLYDSELNRYHTLIDLAYRIWRLCDGVRTSSQIAEATGSDEVACDSVDAAVAQLGESGLLVAPESAFNAGLHRGTMLKLVAAGTTGANGISVSASISIPDSASAQAVYSGGIICPPGTAHAGQCKSPVRTPCNGNGSCCSNDCVGSKPNKYCA